MFLKCLSEIDASARQLEIVKEFNKKYKYRFTLMTQRKIAEYDEKINLSSSSMGTMNEETEMENKSEKKRITLEEKMK